MANSQLTAYASAQLDKGVSREAITQALVGAGWMQSDVDAAVAEVMQQRAGTMNVSVTPGISPTVTVSQDASPVTTTVTATASPVTVSPLAGAASTVSSSPAATAATPSFFATTPSMTMDAATAAPRRSLTWLFVLVGIILALGIIGGGAYALLGRSDVVAPAADANELAVAQQERDQLRAEADRLGKENMAMAKEIAFFAATTTNPVTHEVAGRLSTTSVGAWIVTTPRNVVITIANAKAAPVAAALAPLKDADVTVTGTHAPGSTLLQVTAVNGIAIQAVSSSTAATTTVPGTR